MKCYFRKKKFNTSIKVQRLLTGGGVPPKMPDDPIMNFMNSVSPNLDTEVSCSFDSTAICKTMYDIFFSLLKQFFKCIWHLSI